MVGRGPGVDPGPQASSSQSPPHPVPTPPSLPPDPVLQDESRLWWVRGHTERGAQRPPRVQHGHLRHAGGLGKTEEHSAWHKPNSLPPQRCVSAPACPEQGRGGLWHLVAALQDVGGDGHGGDSSTWPRVAGGEESQGLSCRMQRIPVPPPPQSDPRPLPHLLTQFPHL